VPLDKATGKTLARGVLELTPGTELTGNHIHDLKHAGIKNVHVATTSLKVTPEVPGLQTVKLADNNWISNLSFSRLAQTLQNAPALHQKSPIHSTDPITPYIMGTEFGEGDKGKY
jgi:hypothetical protein